MASEDLEAALSNAVEISAGHATTAATWGTAAVQAKQEVDAAKAEIKTTAEYVKGCAEDVESWAHEAEDFAGIASAKRDEAWSAVDGEFDHKGDLIKAGARQYAEQAEAACADAVTSASNASKSAEEARIALNNGCVYEVRDVADATIGLDKTLTAYKHAPTGDTSYTFNAPQSAEGKIVVFWLWIVMGETAHTLTFPPSVTWLSEPSFAPNTQALLAFMSVDGGATWTANVQWET